MGWASWGLQAPWGCLIGKWDKRRPLDILLFGGLFLWRTFLIIFGGAYSPKRVVACKGLTNFHWRFPGRKKSPSFWNHPIWSSWKPLLLAVRVSPSVYEGVSDKLVCGTKVEIPIRSLFWNAALLTAWSADWFPRVTSVLPFWCPLQWETDTSAGRWTTSKSLRIWSPYLIGEPQVVNWPLSFQIEACACSTRKAYLESV